MRGCPIQAARFWPLEWGFSFAPRRAYGASSDSPHIETCHPSPSVVIREQYPPPMPWGLKRYQNVGTLHFITFSCYRRQPLLMKHGAAQMFVASTRRSADKAWLLCLRLCRHARARPPVGERTRTRPFGHSDQSSQTVRRPATGKSRLRSPIIPTKRPTQAKAAWVGHPHERTGRIANEAPD